MGKEKLLTGDQVQAINEAQIWLGFPQGSLTIKNSVFHSVIPLVKYAETGKISDKYNPDRKNWQKLRRGLNALLNPFTSYRHLAPGLEECVREVFFSAVQITAKGYVKRLVLPQGITFYGYGAIIPHRINYGKYLIDYQEWEPFGEIPQIMIGKVNYHIITIGLMNPYSGNEHIHSVLTRIGKPHIR
jgi:hypothetical protein